MDLKDFKLSRSAVMVSAKNRAANAAMASSDCKHGRM